MPSHICLYTSMAHCLLSILVFNILLLKIFGLPYNDTLFSKWVLNNYGQGGGKWVEIGGVWNILENPNVFKVHGWRQWKCFGIFYLKICSSILWHENVIGGLRNLFTYSRGAIKFSTHHRGIMNFLPSWNISNCPSSHYLLTTPSQNRISSIFYIQKRVEVREYSHSSYVVCVVVFQLGIFLTIMICIIW